MSSASTASLGVAGAGTSNWRCVTATSIRELSHDWDKVVPAGKPHLRADLLQAAEQSGMHRELNFVFLYRDKRPAAAAVTYTVPVDTTIVYPERVRKMVASVRQRRPQFLFRTMVICGSPISNAACGVSFAPDLTRDDRRAALTQLARHIFYKARRNQSICFRDFRDAEVEDFATAMEQVGFQRIGWPASTELELRWKSLDEYLAALKKRYRKRIRDDLKTSAPLKFELLDDFAELAPVAARLYANVLARAQFQLEILNEGFFAEISKVPAARLLVARDPQSNQVLGVNLLLFGDERMDNLYIGFDYEQNERYNIYFSLVEHSLRLAMERGMRSINLGQASYEFKARLGAKPFNLTAYIQHRSWLVNKWMRFTSRFMKPWGGPVTHDVFQSSGTDDDAG
jgi:predicted N-acyltransferase